MTKTHSCKAGWVLTAAVLVLSGCSSFVQQAAPVESPTRQNASLLPSSQSSTAVATPVQTAPYRAEASIPVASAEGQAAPASAGADDGKTHVVQPGENLFRISLKHGLKYQVVAKWNNLPDYNVKVGQVLRLTPPSPTQQAALATAIQPSRPDSAPASEPAVKLYPKALKLAYSENALHNIAALSDGKPRLAAAHPQAAQPSSTGSTATVPAESNAGASAPVANEESVGWTWPTNGKVLRGFSDSNKGIDIGGRMSQAVLAAGDGKVVYCGSGLRGYGKLIIIKHNKIYLSAYAHNSQLLVKEGQSVKKGQKIAEMGNSDADQVKLHFEIRRFGKPVDPMQYLNSKP